ncbi:hypothetical protein [Dipodfec virus UOA04_Rod_734]|nr:hypothetical protein [Dipodfec virus UOA04_Rod_734]
MNIEDILSYVFVFVNLICFVIHFIVSLLTKKAITSLHVHSDSCPPTALDVAKNFYSSHCTKADLMQYKAIFTLCPTYFDFPLNFEENHKHGCSLSHTLRDFSLSDTERECLYSYISTLYLGDTSNGS